MTSAEEAGEVMDYRRVLHLGDPASTASLLREAADTSGRHWRVLPLAKAPSPANQLTATAGKAVRGALWETRLLRERLPVRKVHVHSALARRHAGWAFGSSFVLHLHGTDIRTRQYEAAHAELITSTVRDAHVVFYSTPDLREHVEDLRDDARLVPVPVPLVAGPGGPRPAALDSAVGQSDYIFFPSRWDDAKGGAAQIDLARALSRALSGTQGPALIGLDWGPHAAEAARAGVTLIPTMPHPQFQSVISGARLCIGQLSGVMGASELDVLAADTPLVIPLHPNWYDGSHPSLADPPVHGGTALGTDPHADDVVAVVQRALEGHTISSTRPWVDHHHSPEAAFAAVLDGYRDTSW